MYGEKTTVWNKWTWDNIIVTSAEQENIYNVQPVCSNVKLKQMNVLNKISERLLFVYLSQQQMCKIK